MRLERENGEPRPQVLWVWLNRREARDLMTGLLNYFEQNPVDPGWHHHIGEGDCELTITIESSDVRG